MQIVIDIDEEDYQNLKARDKFDDMCLNYYEKLIVRGTPLPRRHGRLKDIDAFISKVNADRKHAAYSRSWTADDVLAALNNSYAPTIIELDDTESEVKTAINGEGLNKTENEVPWYLKIFNQDILNELQKGMRDATPEERQSVQDYIDSRK